PAAVVVGEARGVAVPRTARAAPRARLQVAAEPVPVVPVRAVAGRVPALVAWVPVPRLLQAAAFLARIRGAPRPRGPAPPAAPRGQVAATARAVQTPTRSASGPPAPVLKAASREAPVPRPQRHAARSTPGRTRGADFVARRAARGFPSPLQSPRRVPFRAEVRARPILERYNVSAQTIIARPPLLWKVPAARPGPFPLAAKS